MTFSRIIPLALDSLLDLYNVLVVAPHIPQVHTPYHMRVQLDPTKTYSSLCFYESCSIVQSVFSSTLVRLVNPVILVVDVDNSLDRLRVNLALFIWDFHSCHFYSIEFQNLLEVRNISAPSNKLRKIHPRIDFQIIAF